VRKVIALYILFIAIAHTVVWKAVIFYPCDFFYLFISTSLISAAWQRISLKSGTLAGSWCNLWTSVVTLALWRTV